MDRNFKEYMKNFDEQNIESFKDSYDNFTNLLSRIREEISPKILQNLNEFFIYVLDHIAKGFKFRLEFVIDTNIIFAEIIAILRNNRSFLKKIIVLPFLKLFSPPRIKRELFSTINDDLPKDLDKEEAVLLANYFLEKIELMTQKNSIAWRKAKIFLAEHDKDDIPFLALAIYLDAHGIITKDQHFEMQNAIDVWKLGKSGRIASIISKGAFSIYILDISLNRIVPTLAKFLFLFFQSFLEFCHEIFASVKYVYSHFKNKYTTSPKWLKIGIPIGIIAIPSLILAFSEKSRKYLKNYFINLKVKLSQVLRCVYDSIKYNIEINKELITELLPFVEFSLDGLGYLLYLAYQFYKKLEFLEDK